MRLYIQEHQSQFIPDVINRVDNDLELSDDDVPVTGFAVASNKRNADFHDLFPTVPVDDYLIEGGFFMCQSTLCDILLF